MATLSTSGCEAASADLLLAATTSVGLQATAFAAAGLTDWHLLLMCGDAHQQQQSSATQIVPDWSVAVGGGMYWATAEDGSYCHWGNSKLELSPQQPQQWLPTGPAIAPAVAPPPASMGTQAGAAEARDAAVVQSGASSERLEAAPAVAEKRRRAGRGAAYPHAASLISRQEADIADPWLELEDLEEIDRDQLPALLGRLHGHVMNYSLDARGCRLVQCALELADDLGQASLTSELRGNVPKALESPHANHVLQKCIEVMRPSAVNFVLLELLKWGPPTALARHRYGCRILERILEHFPPADLVSPVNEILGEAKELCRHVYGNFVMQHVLEHGQPSQRRQVIAALREDLTGVALDQHACSVLDKALSYGDIIDQRSLAREVLQEHNLLARMASLRGGFATTERLFKVVIGLPELHEEARRQIAEHALEIQRSKHGRALLAVVAPECLAATPVAPNGSPTNCRLARGHAPTSRSRRSRGGSSTSISDLEPLEGMIYPP